jgi:acetyl esterase/lipase
MASIGARLHRPIVRWIGGQLAAADTPRKIRAVFNRTSCARLTPAGTRVSDVSLGGVSTLRVTAAPEPSPRRTIVMLHGGGYVFGTPRAYVALASRFARATGAVVYLPDYRLAPEAPYPAAGDDAIAAYRALLQRHQAESIAFVGDSAGGGLALATLQRARDEGLVLPGCAVLLSPWLDPSGSGASMRDNVASEILILPPTIARCARWYAADRDPAEPGISPLFGSPRGLPPILVQVSANEMLYSDSTRFVERASAAGVAVVAEVEPDLWHVWQLTAPTLREARRSIASAGRFVSAHTW